MQDLNDLFVFAKVVQHGGFSAAARALQVTKSSLSKRVARLEQRYEARLIERSTRGFRVTAVGRAVHVWSQPRRGQPRSLPRQPRVRKGRFESPARPVCCRTY
jgi:DNA-binding transcriptional LysR family regulator